MSKNTLQVRVGGIAIGGGAAVSVQSMTNTKTTDVAATIVQIEKLIETGCEIVRVAIPNQEAVRAFAKIKKSVNVPLVADIHFNYKLALGAMDAGADKIRINPGNIGGNDNIQMVVQKAVHCHVPIRIGVNSGSIEKDIVQEEGGPTVKALIKSALRHIEICRGYGAQDLVLSVKSSDVLKTIEAYREASRCTDVPLHLGLTEAGTIRTGTIRSAVALGILLSEGIGDTIRVSLTGDPVDEVIVGKEILKSLGRAPKGITIISCPTCGRTDVDLIPIVDKIERGLARLDIKITIAIMGCVVNGPGEAKEADIGVACGKKNAVLFKNGKIIRKIPESAIADELIQEVMQWENESF
jgi:(E)-4-hydroxy-3-methylbut-2-enyl-diphosphate synthase